MIPVSGSIATPHTSAGPWPSETASRSLLGGTNCPTSSGDVGSVRSRATTPWLYHEEYARSPSVSVLCTVHVPGGGESSPWTFGRSANSPTCWYSGVPSLLTSAAASSL